MKKPLLVQMVAAVFIIAIVLIISVYNIDNLKSPGNTGDTNDYWLIEAADSAHNYTGWHKKEEFPVTIIVFDSVSKKHHAFRTWQAGKPIIPQAYFSTDSCRRLDSLFLRRHSNLKQLFTEEHKY